MEAFSGYSVLCGGELACFASRQAFASGDEIVIHHRLVKQLYLMALGGHIVFVRLAHQPRDIIERIRVI